jgi:hypothetical protein
VASVAARWDDLVRYLALSLTSELGSQVRHMLPKHEASPAARKQALIESLAGRGHLYADLLIPDVAGSLSLVADLKARQVTASAVIDAPKEGTAKGRVSWLLRQMQKAPDGIVVEARAARWSGSAVAPLHAVRGNPSILYPEKGKELRGFRLALTVNMGLKRSSGQGSFSESVSDVTERFYGEVLQNLRAWKAAPPKLKRPEKEAEAAEVVADLVGVEPQAVAEDELPAEGVRPPEPPDEKP